MSLVINPRGPSGSGKTELVRRIVERFGHGSPQVVLAPGRQVPLATIYPHVAGGRPMAVIGSYHRTSGGCDTIREVDGGLDRVFGLAGELAESGCTVLLEGNGLSFEVERTLRLARTRPLLILCLDTQPADCARNLASRRRLGRNALPALMARSTRERQALAQTAARIRSAAALAECEFNTALRAILAVLGIGEAGIAAGNVN